MSYFRLLILPLLSVILCFASAYEVRAESADFQGCKEALKSPPTVETMRILEAAERTRLDKGICDRELVWIQVQMTSLSPTLGLPVKEQISIAERLEVTATKLFGTEDKDTAYAISFLVKPLMTDLANTPRIEALLERHDHIAQVHKVDFPFLLLDGLQMRGALSEARKDWEGAITLYKKSLENWESVRSTAGGWASKSMTQIAQCSQRLERFSDAVTYAQMAAETCERAHQMNSAEYHTIQSLWGMCLSSLGRDDEAMSHFRIAYEYFSTHKPVPVWLCADGYNSAKAMAMFAANTEHRFDKASDILADVEYFAVRGTSETDSASIDAAVALAKASVECGRVRDAVAAFERVLKRRQKVFGETSEIVTDTRDALESLRDEARRLSR